MDLNEELEMFRKEDKERQEWVKSLKPGDKVLVESKNAFYHDIRVRVIKKITKYLIKFQEGNTISIDGKEYLRSGGTEEIMPITPENLKKREMIKVRYEVSSFKAWDKLSNETVEKIYKLIKNETAP